MISNPTAEKNYFRFFNLFLYFFNQLEIIRRIRQKYKYIANFNAFQKIGLCPTDTKTRSQNNYFRFFNIFLYFFNRLDIIRRIRQKYKYIANFNAFQKIGLGPIDIKTRSRKTKKISIFRYFSFFLTGLILSHQADKNING